MQYLDLWQGKELALSEYRDDFATKDRRCAKTFDVAALLRVLNQLLELRKKAEEGAMSRKIKQRIRRLKDDNRWREEKLLELEIKRTRDIHSLFERYDQTRQTKMELMRKEVTAKEKKIREQEQRQKVYLELLQQTEAERKAREANKFNRIALEHVNLVIDWHRTTRRSEDRKS